MRTLAKVNFPTESALYAELPSATFYDAYEAELHDPSLNAVEICLRAMASTPAWVGMLLELRDRLVAPVGLKAVGALGPALQRAPASYAAGDQIGLFSVLAITDKELVLGIDDEHLDVRIAFLKRSTPRGSAYAVCSVVKTHNLLGRAYMAPVGRIHPLIVRTLMRRCEV